MPAMAKEVWMRYEHDSSQILDIEVANTIALSFQTKFSSIDTSK